MQIKLIEKYSNTNFFIILLSLIILFLTYKYNLYKFPEAINGPLMPWDGDRYLRPNNLLEMINSQYFNSFPLYYFFVGLFKKLNIIYLLPIVQFLMLHIISIYFFKILSKTYNIKIAYICWFLIILNPIFFKWCHAANPLIITIALSLLSLSLLISKDNKIIFTFIVLILLLKNDAKLILNYLILSSFFIFKIYKRSNKLILILIIFSTILLTINHLSLLNESTSSGFILFKESAMGYDIVRQGAVLSTLSNEVLLKCSYTEMNSIKNHLCMIFSDLDYSLELYSKRFLYGIFWISPNWSIQYQILSKTMLVFYYVFLIYGFKKNINNLIYILNFIAPFLLVLPYILDGNQRFVTHAYIFITPIAGIGFYVFLNKYFKWKN